MGNDPSLSLSHLTPAERQVITQLAAVFAARQDRTTRPGLIVFVPGRSSKFDYSQIQFEALAQRPLHPDNKRDKTVFFHAFDIAHLELTTPAEELPDEACWQLRLYETDEPSRDPIYESCLRYTPRHGWSLQHLGEIPAQRFLPDELHQAHLWALAGPAAHQTYYLTTRIPYHLQVWQNPNPWDLPHFERYHAITEYDPKTLPEHLLSICLDLVVDQISPTRDTGQ